MRGFTSLYQPGRLRKDTFLSGYFALWLEHSTSEGHCIQQALDSFGDELGNVIALGSKVRLSDAGHPRAGPSLPSVVLRSRGVGENVLQRLEALREKQIKGVGKGKAVEEDNSE
jgi:hypothetical protein